VPVAWVPTAGRLTIERREEIARDFPDGLDYLITGVGTGGHITACAEVLKPLWPALKVFAVEPMLSPVLSGGTHSSHSIQRIGAGFIPGVLRTDLLDGVIQVTPEDAMEYARRSALEEGVLIGVPSGAALATVAQKLPDMADGARTLTFAYDSGERYLSVEGLFP
jgi:cysteine synthase A